MWTSADYELAWPKDIFVYELEAIAANPYRPRSSLQLSCLIREAFTAEQPCLAYEAVRYTQQEREFVDDLLANRYELPESIAPRQYWPRRHAPARSRWALTPRLEVLTRRIRHFSALIDDLRRKGYMAKELSERCPSDRSGATAVDIAAFLAERLGRGHGNLWPLDPGKWDPAVFYGLIEVFHDLVARPRSVEHCKIDGCVGHFSDFSIATGRRLYRWKVNCMLEATQDPLRLAESGEDVGRLVRMHEDPRTPLLAQALGITHRETARRVDHAIALFRRRDVTEEDKRSAIVELATVLESRRKLLKKSLFTGDENALFKIANEFDNRHNNESQRADYDPAFRDWVFWWYLATVELTDRLLARQRGQVSAGVT